MSKPRMILTWFIVPVTLGLVVMGLTRLFRVSTSETFDETIYLWLGYGLFRNGNVVNLASPMCPPLPILLEFWLPALRARTIPGTEAFNWEVPGLIRQARFATSLLIGAPLVVLVYGWLCHRRGWAVGFLGALVLALSPTFLAAASLATTDACFALFAVLAVAAIHGYQNRPTRSSYLLMAVAIGLALGAKQTAAIFFPVALLELLLSSPARAPGATRVDHALRVGVWLGIRFAGLVGLAFLVDWALYGFAFAPPFGHSSSHLAIPDIVTMVARQFPNHEAFLERFRLMGPPLAIDTFVGQLDHASRGPSRVLLGRTIHQRLAGLLPRGDRDQEHASRTRSPRDHRPSGVPPGHVAKPAPKALDSDDSGPNRRRDQQLDQYRAPIHAAVLSADCVDRFRLAWRRGRASLRQTDQPGRGRGVLAGDQSGGDRASLPAYFNGIIGGPSQGYRYLVDSSLDWGQDLPALREELEARGYHKVALGYFGQAKPTVYGLRWVNWMAAHESEVADCDWLAISATTFQGVYGFGAYTSPLANLYVKQVGYNMFLYDFKDPRVRQAWRIATNRQEETPRSAGP